jgi:hypothetical protein
MSSMGTVFRPELKVTRSRPVREGARSFATFTRIEYSLRVTGPEP